MLRPGVNVINKFKGLHHFMNWNKPLITDSGGFQVFSLAKNSGMVKIDDNGVTFRSHWDGKKIKLTPKKSIKLQHSLGADIIIAFDDCATYPINRDLASESVNRTHKWAKQSLEAHVKLRKEDKKDISIYAVVQGSVYKNLREKSAKFLNKLNFDGFAIGGVSVGESKNEMNSVLEWVIPYLPYDKPRHLLGVGEIGDVFSLVKHDVDTFDCVLPTRIARTGQMLVKKGKIDITKSIYSLDIKPIEKGCKCYTCLNFTRSYVHHLFKVRELLAYRLATIHNLYFMEDLMEKIRNSIVDNSMDILAKEYV